MEVRREIQNVQTGTERFILQCLIGSKIEELRKVSVERNSLRVLMLMFWTTISQKIFDRK